MTLTLSRPQEAHLTSNRRRPLGLTRARETIQQLTTQRSELRDTRQYAEQWYQAIRLWSTDSYEIERPAGSGLGSGVEFLTSGEDGPLMVSFLVTPLGRQVNEGAAGRAITDMTLSIIPETVQLGKMLSRLRKADNGCALSLLRPDGRWERNREGAVRYAVAVLTLAVRLGDVQAERPLQQVRVELRALTITTC